MKKMALFIAIAVVLTAICPASLAAEAPRNRYEIDMELMLDDGEVWLDGVFRITAVNDSADEWEQLCLRDYAAVIFEQAGGGATYVTGVSGSGGPIEYYIDIIDPSIIYVRPEEPLKPGGSLEFEVAYSANIPQSELRCSWNDTEGGTIIELSYFYPVLAAYDNGEWVINDYVFNAECFYARCADYSLKFTLPSTYTVVASGSEEKTEIGGGLATWSINAENYRDIALTACDSFELLSGSYGGVEVNSWYFSRDPQAREHARQALAAALKSMELFTGLIGAYPYEELDIVMTRVPYGMEYPALVRISDYDFDFKKTRDVTAHELGHQWFYAVVGSDNYNEAWLDEGFANFLELMYYTTYMTEAEIEEYMEGREQRVNQSEKAAAAYLNTSYGELGSDYTRVVYIKGQVFLYKLMKLMGEQAFFEMLQDYYQTWSFKEAKSADFVAAVLRHDDSAKVAALLDAYIFAS